LIRGTNLRKDNLWNKLDGVKTKKTNVVEKGKYNGNGNNVLKFV